jgi:prepilin-type N-terminal cleavage/methylation domain-containing protein
MVSPKEIMKRAFTLIELLVVIAIIAILAAILFPVFAQAKLAAKKTQYISNLKQTGTSVMIYTTDSDDIMPHAYMVRETGTWAWGVVTPVPANSVQTAPWNNPIRVANSQSFWANAIQPYTKNFQLLEQPDGIDLTVAGEIPTIGVLQARMGIVYNGYLHAFSGTAINNGAVVPMFWHQQKNNFVRRGFSNPALLCQGGDPVAAAPCQWNPSGPPNGVAGSSNGGYYAFGGGATTWTYGGRRGAIVRCDTSTKSVPSGTAVTPAFVGFAGKLSDPWAGVNVQGVPASLWTCDSTFLGQTPPGQDSWCFFRPDRFE